MANADRNRGGATSPASFLFTDLYELTMAQAYLAEGMEGTAVFELFFRTLPPERNWILAAGLGDVLEFLEHATFRSEDLDYLRRLGTFQPEFIAHLETLRFRGDVFAVPEGTIVFPNEPLIQVVAPIAQAQLVETYVLNQIHFQSVLATKAARVVEAAAGRAVYDFGARRAHGEDSALAVAKLSYMAGAAGTSNVLAGRLWDIPVAGTMAHSYIQAHESELDAFAAFARVFPETVLLVDTYDTIAGVERVIELSRRLGEEFRVRAIRLDSGDLGELAREARRRLDRAGLDHVEIFASGGLDERAVARLVTEGAPISGFGVGTSLAVSRDAPDLDMAYKLVEYEGKSRLKLSSAKAILPGRKQIFREVGPDGRIARDVLGLHDETQPGRALIEPVMRKGQRVADRRESLVDIRERVRREIDRLPPRLRSIDPADPPYEVATSAALRAEAVRRRRELGGRTS